MTCTCMQANHEKKSLRSIATTKGSDQPTKPLAMMSVSTVHQCILQNAMILQADGGGTDQTARQCSLIWAYAVRICAEVTFSPFYFVSIIPCRARYVIIR